MWPGPGRPGHSNKVLARCCSFSKREGKRGVTWGLSTEQQSFLVEEMALLGGGYSSAVECMPSLHEVVGLIPSTSTKSNK